MKVKVELRHEKAQLPKKANPTDAGADLYATSVKHDIMYVEYNCGIGIEIPKGYVGKIYPRSSISNYDLILCNSTGIIDYGYVGDIKLRFRITEHPSKIYEVGDRIGQIIIEKLEDIEFQVGDIKGDRGGFGSSN